MAERLISGIGVSPGIVIGEVRVRTRKRLVVRPRPLKEGGEGVELRRFDRAVSRTERDITRVGKQVRRRLGAASAGIFDAHLMILKDPMLVDRTRQLINEERINADFAVLSAMSEIQQAFRRVKDELFRQRLIDVEDVGRRLIEYIQSDADRRRTGARSNDELMLVAEDLSPSEAAELEALRVTAVITEKGSQTSHTAILCRSLGVPALVGMTGLLEHIKDGDLVIVDANAGELIVDPTPRTILRYTRRQRILERFNEQLAELHDQDSVTQDGHAVELSSNIELPLELDHVIRSGGKGIGLFRTEYLYLAASSMPDEEMQYREYIRAAKAVKPERLIIRTFDLGGDKQPASMKFPQEANPFLGWRAVRVSLDDPAMFRVQLRAILRASVMPNIQLMFPMISGVTQLQQVLDALEEVKAELRSEGVAFNEDIRKGIMIEVPSAVLVARELASMVDFFSIGTNDLTQYMIAVDRNNATVAHLYQSTHPAVIRSIAMTVQAAHEEGIWVGMCGEMAGDPAMTALLVGLGLDELSVSPVILPEIKMLIRQLKLDEARKLSRKVLEIGEVGKIQRVLDQDLRRRVGKDPLWRPQISKQSVKQKGGKPVKRATRN